ncbi:MAG TPA: (d)CMP kinase [Steroidobacteraceae bacterium]|nr:(d)CMP kinase [Steroidobacteraceae bacterium]
MTDSAPVVTIDGPSGSGKGTISRGVAQVVGWHLLDSGALYRLVAYAGSDQGLDPADREGHARVAASMQVTFGVGPDGSEQVLLAGRDVTQGIRTETAGQGASRVAAWPGVRTALLERQRAFARPPGLVADGRDMGTVVFPQAPLKIYLTASAEERARRRHKQLKDKGSGVSLSALSREITERDARDSTRAVAPLIPAPDAEVIDSTGLSIEAVVGRVLELGARRSLWLSPRA